MLFHSKVFRDEAVARRSRPEPLDDRLQVTAPHEWVVVLGVALSVVALLAWGLFGRVEHGLTEHAVLVRPGDRSAVLSPLSGTVIEVLAEQGDTLAAGQAIARVRLPEAQREARIAQRIVTAVAGTAADGAAAGALLEAARSELAAIERRAETVIVAPQGGMLVLHHLTAGQPVHTGQTVAQVRGASDEAWQALAFVAADDAGKLQLQVGKPAKVLVRLPGHAGEQGLAARVAEVSPRAGAAAAWLVDFGVAPPVGAHLLRLVLVDAPPAGLADGAAGRARVALGPQSLAALLIAGDRR